MWNHRIVRTINEGECFELAEVFYDTENKPYAYGEASIVGSNIYEIRQQIDMFDFALTKPVLNYPDDFTGDANI